MTSLFPGPDAPPRPALNRNEIPTEYAMDFGQLLDWFTPQTFVCWIILAINVVIFCAMLLSGFNPDHASPEALLKWGADYGPLTVTEGQWWRALTACFVHLGVVHIGFNMLVLAQIGPLVERVLGNAGFLMVYLVSGIAGSICSLAWNPYLISAGASGAIFGLYGALIGFLILRRDSVHGPVVSKLLRGAGIFLIYNVFFGVLKSGTDLAAHAGGLAGGLICGCLISTPMSDGFVRRRLQRALATTLGCAIILLGLATRLPHPIDFQRELVNFASSEAQLLATYRSILKNAKTSTDVVVAKQIEDQVMKPWSIARQRLALTTGLPKPQQRFFSVLLTYVDARQAAWSILVRGLKTHDVTLVKQGLRLQAEAPNIVRGALRSSQ